jgi:hypothetical protein
MSQPRFKCYTPFTKYYVGRLNRQLLASNMGLELDVVDGGKEGYKRLEFPQVFLSLSILSYRESQLVYTKSQALIHLPS